MKVFFTAIIFFASFSFADSQWITQQSGTVSNLKCVHLTDDQTGFICGDNVILKTTNAGNNWNKNELSGIWNSVYFVNSITGYLCGNNGKIMKTTNAGENWFAINSGTDKNLTSIRFVNDQTGYFTGWYKTLLKTTDGGVTFSNTFGSAYYMWQKTFIINSYVFLMGNDGALFRSTNSGSTWDSLYTGMPNSLSSAQFFNNGKGFIFGCCGAFFRTSNFGNHWQHDTVYLTKGWALEDCYFSNDLTGWSVGENGSIVRTTDGGALWETLPFNNNSITFKSVKFVNNQTGWIVGTEGTILKTTNGGGQGIPIGIETQHANVPAEFLLQQNFPNPFNPSTNIKFVLNRSSNVKLSIYNINGKLENILTEDFYREGEYQVTWKAVNQPSGIYYCKIETNNGSQVVKMSLIK
ncbi:MAG: T9SS type A sorting domain-containing protein [Ignavibacteria bacterium]|nr:T9SS type A sorting domain-containing protein [Ignavibacteria bacterium]